MAYASLVGAKLTGTILEDADLRSADLSLACFNGTRCTGADLSDALLSKTVLARLPDLHRAHGLASLRFGDASSIDVATLRVGMAALPTLLLEQAGMTDAEINTLRTMFGLTA